MNEHHIPTIDAFLDEYVWGLRCFADDETFERATEDARDGGDFLPLTYDRALVDPRDPSRLMVSFTYGTDNLDHALRAPQRVEQCMAALVEAHPELAGVSMRLSVSGF